MRLQGKRRLRSPKLKIKPRVEAKESEAKESEAKESEAKESEAKESEAKESEAEAAPKWSTRMKKDELRAVAESLGILVTDEWSKDDIVVALREVSS